MSTTICKNNTLSCFFSTNHTYFAFNALDKVFPSLFGYGYLLINQKN